MSPIPTVLAPRDAATANASDVAAHIGSHPKITSAQREILTEISNQEAYGLPGKTNLQLLQQTTPYTAAAVQQVVKEVNHLRDVTKLAIIEGKLLY